MLMWHFLISVCEGLVAFSAYAHAALIETSILPQTWLRVPSNVNARLLPPSYFTITLYALSEPLYYLFWTRLLTHASDTSVGITISSIVLAPALVAFALPDDLDRPSPSPWQSKLFLYAANAFVIQAAAAQNAAWLLMAVTPERNEHLRTLHVTFGLMAMFAATSVWVFAWWEFMGPLREISTIWRRIRKDPTLRSKLILDTALLLAARSSSRWILGLSPLAAAPL